MKTRYFALLLSAALAAPTLAADWTVPSALHPTIQAAIDDLVFVQPGDTILVGPGDHYGALVTKRVTIKGTDGARITDGPPRYGMSQGFRLLEESGGTTISHLTFTTGLSIMNGAAVNTVTVTQCTFLDSVQAISNWRGSDWEITHNKIVDLRTNNGGGIGVLIADYAGGVVENNVVSHNTFEGTLSMGTGELGGYNGSAIVLYADFRWGGSGTSSLAYNRVVKNKVSMVSSNPGLVDIVAFELTDTRDDPLNTVIHDNLIGFNDWRGTAQQVDFTPDELEVCNQYSRNFGENRGHGLHPTVFGPGGN